MKLNAERLGKLRTLHATENVCIDRSVEGIKNFADDVGKILKNC
jgi:hypothetical protein